VLETLEDPPDAKPGFVVLNPVSATHRSSCFPGSNERFA
jgi:hypothetical protein